MNISPQAMEAFERATTPGNGPRICIIGYGRHGKDEAAAALHKTGKLRYGGSTSWFALSYVAEELREPPQFAWENRHLCRPFWNAYCNFLRKEDPLFLVRLALEKGNVVAGVRDLVEIQALKDSGLFDAILWVNRPGFPVDLTVSYEPAKFCTDWILNIGTVEELRTNVVEWAKRKGLLNPKF